LSEHHFVTDSIWWSFPLDEPSETENGSQVGRRRCPGALSRKRIAPIDVFVVVIDANSLCPTMHDDDATGSAVVVDISQATTSFVATCHISCLSRSRPPAHTPFIDH